MNRLKTTDTEYHAEKVKFLANEIRHMTRIYIRCKSQILPEDREGFTPSPNEVANSVTETSKVSVPII